MLHKKDNSPIRFARICKEEEKEVPYSDIVKGFEYEKDAFVVIDEEDFKAANVKKTSTIEIQYFTDVKAIEPIYFEKPYFLEPDKKAGKAYQLLNEALNKSKKTAVVNYVFRNKEHIGVILPSKEGLLLIQMRYHAEIRSFEELDLPTTKTSAKELQMALTLIDQLTKRFEPEKHHDTYTEELMHIIEQKLKGKKPAGRAKKTAPSHGVRDLMGLLQASLKKSIDETAPKKKKRPSISSASKRTQARKRSS